jgi:hypothetical protein
VLEGGMVKTEVEVCMTILVSKTPEDDCRACNLSHEVRGVRERLIDLGIPGVPLKVLATPWCSRFESNESMTSAFLYQSQDEDERQQSLDEPLDVFMLFEFHYAEECLIGEDDAVEIVPGMPEKSANLFR